MRLERLDKIAEIIAGQSPPSETYNKEGIGLPFFQGKADYGEMYPKVRYWCSVPTKLSYPNDILISVRAPVGPVNINNVKACIGRGLSAIRPIYENQTLYIYYYLKAIESDIARLGVGSTFTAITQKDLSGIKIPIPEDINDQKRIASILGKAEKLIAQRKETIKLLDEFLKSVFLHMFGDPVRNEKGWEMERLDKYIHDIKSGSSSSDNPKDKNWEGIEAKILKVSAVSSGEFNPLEYKTIDWSQLGNKLLSPQEEDLLFSRANTRELVGSTCIVDKNYPDLYLPDKLWIIVPYDYRLKYYLHYLLQNKGFKQRLTSNATGTSGSMLNISMAKLSSLLIPVPDEDLLIKFTAIARNVKTLRKQYKASLQELENLYGSLSQRAFKGELDLSKVLIEEEFGGNVQPETWPEFDDRKKKSDEKDENYVHADGANPKEEQPDNFTGPETEEDKRYGDPFEGRELPKGNRTLTKEEVSDLLGIDFDKAIGQIEDEMTNSSPKRVQLEVYDRYKWKETSIEQVSRWIKERYTNYHFSFDMLYRYLSTRIADLPYYSTIDLIKKPGIKEENTFKGFWFKVLTGEIEYLSLKQFFYNAETEQPLLTITPDDYSLIKDKPAKLRSGVYYEVVP
ncbi:MAG: hypothetical protein BGO70_10345 [Bacteroidetes bacterium 43-93]|nr:restriction endonuclease subunit S [Bacteroidota bacterium]OJX00552.1 MAG: hypothetical protein BGO70_10345 [Bacteroidetes bacterium 43-93]